MHLPPRITAFLLSKETSERWSSRLPDIAFVYLLFSLSYFFWYLTEPSVPASATGNYLGWWGWWDQGQYWKTAGELASGHLGQSQYWWGYPLIGMLFYKVMPAHAFFFPNYLFAYIVVLSFYMMAIRFVTRVEAYVLMFALILGSREMMFTSLIVPWNTIITYASVFSISYLLVILKASRQAVFFCIGLVGLSALVRPTDTPLLLSFLVLAVYFQFDFKAFIKLTAAATLIVVIGAAIHAPLNQMAFGQITPPYVAAQDAVGFSLSGVGFRLYQLYVDGSLIHGHSALVPSAGSISPTFLSKLPLMVFSLAGGWLLWSRIGHRALLLIYVCFGQIFFYATFNASGNPPHFWSYSGFHFLWWPGVILSLLGYIFLRELALRCGMSRTVKGLAVFSVMALAAVGYGEDATTYFIDGTNGYAPPLVMQQLEAKTQLTFNIQANNEKGLRLAFRNSLPFNLTVAGEGGRLVSIEVNGEKWRYWKDFMVSQEGNTINLHFYRSPPVGKATVIITLAGLEKPDLASAQWIRIKFQPFATVYRLTNWLFGSAMTVGQSPNAARPYRVGDMLRFGSADGNQNFLLSGWSHPEKEHVWSVNKMAQIRLGVKPNEFTGNGCSIDLDFATFGANTLQLTMNGKAIGQPVMTSGNRQILRFSPCPESSAADLILGLKVNQLRSPASVRSSNDHRQLGLALFSVRLIRE